MERNIVSHRRTSIQHCCCLDYILHESYPQKHKPICSKQWFNQHCLNNDSIFSYDMLPAACYSNSVYTCSCKIIRVRKAFKIQMHKTDYYGKSSKSQSVRKTNEIGGEIKIKAKLNLYVNEKVVKGEL